MAEIITPHGSLALVGQSLNKLTSLSKTSRSIVKRHGAREVELKACNLHKIWMKTYF